MTTIRIHIILLLSLSVAFVFGQIDTVLMIPTVEVEGFKVREGAIGGSIVVFDTTDVEELPHASISEVLQRKSNVYVKTYGGNSLSTLSIRGASGSQNLVTWNGLPVQSSMLGLLDLSLIPSSFADEIQLEAGGNSSSWGSGAIGGLLSFNQRTSFDSKIKLDYSSSIGSFGNLHQGLSLQIGNRYFQSRTQVEYQKAKNDIVYRAAPSLPKERQENAAFEQLALLQTFAARPNDYNHLELHLWLQKSEKELPPTVTQLQSLAFQTDRFKRLMGSYKLLKGKHNLNVKGAVFREKQNYQDPQILLDANNDFTNYLTEFSYKYQVNNVHGLEFTNTNIFTRAESESYDKLQKLDRFGLLLAYKLQKESVALQLSVREEMANGKVLVPVAYAGLEVKVGANLLLKAKVTRDFRLPTLNDLYWAPGGNIDLLPEQGWSQEVGLDFSKQFGKHKLSLGQNFFNRNIKDWILWAPSSNSFFWQASNINKVWSWGSESAINYSLKIENFHFKYSGKFNYISSTYQSSLDLPKITKGDQLLYTPEFQWNNLLHFKFKRWSFNYEHLFVGETQAVNGVLEPYNVANVSTSLSFNEKNIRTRLFLTVNNIFNKNYTVVERRPSPGINFQLGLHLNFKK